ncbi:Mut7-C RNAse domain-containing protein [Pseudothermotoga sp.]|nr:Mut7-C RNAse domain-containing protein [Pseudothermotoga sp.]MCX7812393.1 Mut7-C RNAse domain-containing protein [Pseudothermotoga sp.]MDW8140153.1 Mut7-C RNAse domain-containing protein [Pseudothermotoga sp.]
MFFVDRMLGKLAKKLRLLGFDTVYSSHMCEEEIMQLCKETGRILITKDRELLRKAVEQGIRCLYVASDDWRQQLVELSKKIDLKSSKRMSRCSLCNVELINANEEEIKKKVPFYVQQTCKDFYLCPACGRVYWAGSHVEHAEETFRRLGL